jgi:putative FmdB family regulatory protein
MPTYEYKCDACGHEFEKFQPMTAAALKKCPQCGKSRLRRLIGTGAGLIFKGSGFYTTDYRSDSYKKSAKSDQAPAAADAKKSGDAKPAETAKPVAAVETAPVPKAKAKPAKEQM